MLACQTSRDLRLGELRLRHVRQIHVAMLDLAISELSHDLEHFGPCRVHLLVDLLVHLDGHAKFELLAGHFAFLSRFTIVAAATSGTATALKAAVFTTIFGDATLWPGV